LNTSIEFQEQYNLQEILQPLASTDSSDTSNGLYQLTGIVVHLGTAMGGHYKTFVRSLKDGNIWWECNDDNIHRCSEEEMSTLFNSSSSNGTQQQSLVMENAYILFYSRVSSAENNVFDYNKWIPVTAEVEKDNESYETLMKISNIQRKIYHFDVQIYRINEIQSINSVSYPFDFPKQMTLSEVTQKIYERFINENVLSAEEYSLANVRLRKFSNTRTSKGETFDNRMNLKLSETNFLLKELVCFEIRKENDPVFIEYNPNEMLLSFHLWDATTSSASELESFVQSEIVASKEGDASSSNNNASKWIEITVPGLEKATVQDLFATIREKFGFAEDDHSFGVVPFIQNSNIPLLKITEDMKSEDLRKKYSIFPGTKMIIEKSAESVGEGESKVVNVLKSLRSKLHLFFNNPKLSTANNESDLPEYNIEIETTSDITLLQLKELIKNKLSLSEGVEEFYCKMNKDGNQYKEENKTLEELGITDQSILHVSMGKGCNTNEHFIRFELDIGRLLQLAFPNGAPVAATGGGGVADSPTTNASNNPFNHRYILLEEIPVNEKSTILSMKKTLFSQWETLVANFHSKFNSLPHKDELLPYLSNLLLHPTSLHHIRLRDYKNGKISAPLRDDRMICRTLLGLSDGRRIILQILPQEEIIGPDDLLITVRYVFYYYNKMLSDAYDLSIPRAFKIKDLYEKLNAHFPQVLDLPQETYDVTNKIENSPIQRDENNYIEIAKGFTTGPPLTLKSSLKLKWEVTKKNVYPEGGEGECIGESDIDRPPMNLRDGAILVLRNRFDYLKAHELSQQKLKEKQLQEASAGAGEDGVIGVGGGASAVRARRPGSSARHLRPGSSASSTRSMRGSSTEPMLKIVTTQSTSGSFSAETNNTNKSHRPPLPGMDRGSLKSNKEKDIPVLGGSPNENNNNNTSSVLDENLPEPSPTKKLEL
jgi:hypothetical protein